MQFALKNGIDELDRRWRGAAATERKNDFSPSRRLKAVGAMTSIDPQARTLEETMGIEDLLDVPSEVAREPAAS